MPVVGFAGDDAFGISVNEITACGRGDWPPVTMVVFRNFQWGAEKRNTTLWCLGSLRFATLCPLFATLFLLSATLR